MKFIKAFVAIVQEVRYRLSTRRNKLKFKGDWLSKQLLKSFLEYCDEWLEVRHLSVMQNIRVWY